MQPGPGHHSWKHGLFSRHWDDKKQHIYERLAAGELTDLEAAHEVHAVAWARFDAALEQADIVDPRTLTGIQSEYRMAVRGIVEARSQQVSAEETAPATVDVAIRVVDGSASTSVRTDDEK